MGGGTVRAIARIKSSEMTLPTTEGSG